MLVFIVRHAVVVGISLAPRIDVFAVPIKQDGVVIITVVDGVAMLGRRQGFQIYLGHDPDASAVTNRPLTSSMVEALAS